MAGGGAYTTRGGGYDGRDGTTTAGAGPDYTPIDQYTSAACTWGTAPNPATPSKPTASTPRNDCMNFISTLLGHATHAHQHSLH